MTLTNVPSLLEHHWKNVYFKHNRNITKITVMQIDILLFLLFVKFLFFFSAFPLILESLLEKQK